MRAILKWAGRVVLALILAAAVVGIWNREELARLWAVQTLFAEDRIVANFSHMDAAFLTTPLPRAQSQASALPEGDRMTLPDGAEEWLAERAVEDSVRSQVEAELAAETNAPPDEASD